MPIDGISHQAGKGNCQSYAGIQGSESGLLLCRLSEGVGQTNRCPERSQASQIESETFHVDGAKAETVTEPREEYPLPLPIFRVVSVIQNMGPITTRIGSFFAPVIRYRVS